MRVYSTSLEEEHPFDEEKIIEAIEHQRTRNQSESRDDGGMQQNTKDPFEVLVSLSSSWTNRGEAVQNAEIERGKGEIKRKKKKKIPKEDEVKERVTRKAYDARLNLPSKPKMALDDLASVSASLIEEGEEETMDKSNRQSVQREQQLYQKAGTGSFDLMQFDDIEASRATLQQQHLSLKPKSRNAKDRPRSNQEAVITMDPLFASKDYKQQDTMGQTLGTQSSILEKNSVDKFHNSRSANLIETEIEQSVFPGIEKARKTKKKKKKSKKVKETNKAKDEGVQDLNQVKDENFLSLNGTNRTSRDEAEESLGLMPYIPSKSFETTTDETELRDLQSNLEHGLKKLLYKAGVPFPPGASAEKIKNIFEKNDEKIRKHLENENMVAAEKKASKKEKKSKMKENPNEVKEDERIEESKETRDAQEDIGLMNYIPDGSFEKAEKESNISNLQNELEIGLKKLLDKAGVSYPSNASGDEIKEIFENKEEAIKKYLDENKEATKEGKVKKRHKNKKSKKKKSKKTEETNDYKVADLRDIKSFDDININRSTSFEERINGIVSKQREQFLTEDGDHTQVKEMNATETAGQLKKKKNRLYESSQFDTFAPELLQKEENFGSLNLNDKYATAEDEISLLTEDMYTFRDTRAELQKADFLKPEFITKRKPQGKRQGKQLEGGTVVTKQDDFITKVVCVASTPQQPIANERTSVNKTNQSIGSQAFPGLRQFAELPNAAMQALKSEAIAGDLFSQAGVYSSITPQNNLRPRQPTTTTPFTFKPGMTHSLVPRTTALQRSNHSNAIIPLVPMMNAVARIMEKSGKKFLKSDVVDETVGLVDDIRWAFGNDDFSCNNDNSYTESDSCTSAESLQSDLRSVERGIAGYFQQGLSSIYETVAQNFDDDNISNSGSTYSQSSFSRSSYSRVSYASYANSRAKSQASYAKSRAASSYARKYKDTSVRSRGERSYAANSQQESVQSQRLSTHVDSRAEALLQEKEALEDAIADLRAQKNLLEMQSKLKAQNELKETNASLKAEKAALEQSIIEPAGVHPHNNSKYMKSNCDASLSQTSSAYMKSDEDARSAYMKSDEDVSVKSHSSSYEYGISKFEIDNAQNMPSNYGQHTRGRRNSENVDGQASVYPQGASSYAANRADFERRMVPYGSSSNSMNAQSMVLYGGSSSQSDHGLVPYDYEGRALVERDEESEYSEYSEYEQYHANPMFNMINNVSNDIQAKISRVHDVVKIMLSKIGGYGIEEFDPANETAIVLHEGSTIHGELGSMSGAMIVYDDETLDTISEQGVGWSEVDVTVRKSAKDTVNFLGGIFQDSTRVC